MDSLQKILENLNDKQLEAVKTTEGYVRVIAGAGSGKTKALTSRFAYLVEGLGISSSNILCVTFTNKAAQEMKKRIRTLVSEGNETNLITTYHGFCVQVLRQDINKLAYPKGFIIMDVEDQKSILREVYNELDISIRDNPFRVALKYIHDKKSSLEYIKELENTNNKAIAIQNGSKESILQAIFASYLIKQKKNFALDFDDLICFTFYIFTKHQEVLQKWQQRLHYIQADEFQDSSKIQYELIAMLSNYHQNLFVVGDPDQTIYEWRGAKPEYLVNFNETLKPCTSIIMDQNYRSTPNILSIGNSIINNNKLRVEKEMFTSNKDLLKTVHFHGKSEQEESQWIIRQIKELTEKKEVELKDIGILCRANHISRYIEQALINANIDYIIFGGTRFFERKEIKDAIAYLRLIVYGDDLSFLRIVNEPKRGIGKKRILFLKQKSEEQQLPLYKVLLKNINNKIFKSTKASEFLDLIDSSKKEIDSQPISDFLQSVLERSGLLNKIREDGDEDRLDNIKELITSIITYEKEQGESVLLTEYLQEIALYTNLDHKKEINAINLMTIHTSKGLEFPYVFLCGFSEAILPNIRSIRERKKRGLEEERRLAYVAVTRAKKGLFLTESEGFNNESISKFPSRFLFEIKKDLIEEKGKMNGSLISEARLYVKQVDELLEDGNTLFQIDDICYHPIWEDGKIVAINEQKNEYEIWFDCIAKVKPISMNFKQLKRKILD